MLDKGGLLRNLVCFPIPEKMFSLPVLFTIVGLVMEKQTKRGERERERERGKEDANRGGDLLGGNPFLGVCLRYHGS